MNGKTNNQSGDFEQMEQIFDRDDHQMVECPVVRYRSFVLNFPLRSGVSYIAEALVQQTFLPIYRYWAQYKPSAKFTIFLFMIAHQVWIKELKTQSCRKQLPEKLVEEPFISISCAIGMIYSARPQETEKIFFIQRYSVRVDSIFSWGALFTRKFPMAA